MPYTVDLRKKVAEKPEPKVEPKPVFRPVFKPIVRPVIPEPTEMLAEPSDNVSWLFQRSGPAKKQAYIISMVLLGVGILASFLNQDFSLAGVMVLAGLVLIVSSHRVPKIYDVRIDASTVSVYGQKYFHNDLKSFWLNYQPPHVKELSLEFKKRFQPRLVIPLEDADPLEIRRLMVSLVPEKEHEDSLLDQMVRRFNI